jgi:hypothetical protein
VRSSPPHPVLSLSGRGERRPGVTPTVRCVIWATVHLLTAQSGGESEEGRRPTPLGRARGEGRAVACPPMQARGPSLRTKRSGRICSPTSGPLSISWGNPHSIRKNPKKHERLIVILPRHCIPWCLCTLVVRKFRIKVLSRPPRAGGPEVGGAEASVPAPRAHGPDQALSSIECPPPYSSRPRCSSRRPRRPAGPKESAAWRKRSPGASWPRRRAGASPSAPGARSRQPA